MKKWYNFLAFKNLLYEKPLKYWSSCPEVFCKENLENFAKFTGKHLSRSLFFSLRPADLLKRLRHRCFFVNVAKFLRTPCLCNTFGGCSWRWLFLCISDEPPIYQVSLSEVQQYLSKGRNSIYVQSVSDVKC